MAALADEPGEEAARLRLAALLQAGDWGEVGRTAEAAIERAGDRLDRDPVIAEAVLSLGLAHARLGRPADAEALAARYGPKLGDGVERALLDLATSTTLPATSREQLPAAAGRLAATVRAKLDQLPPLDGDGQRPVRTASERSTPAG